METVTDEATDRSIGFVYNTEGRISHLSGPVTTVVSDGIWVNYQHDSDGNLTRVAYADDGNGSSVSGFDYRYEDPNDANNLTEKHNLAGEFISSWAYDSNDRAYENINRDGKGVTITGYDAANVVVTDAQGIEKTHTIETINGRKTITNIAGGGCGCSGDAVRYGYDDLRRVTEIEHANGRIDRYADFDGNERYQTEIHAAGTAEERILHYTYHPETGDRLTITEASTLGDGDKEIVFDYDDDGNSTPNENPTRRIHRKIERGFTFDAAHITAYTYTAKGLISAVNGPLPGDQDEITYTYNPATDLPKHVPLSAPPPTPTIPPAM